MRHPGHVSVGGAAGGVRVVCVRWVMCVVFDRRVIGVGWIGEPIPRRLSNTWWNVARRKAGIDDLHFHDLRHEFGSQLLEAGGELHEVQATLGHTNIKMTRTYLNATTQGVKQAFKKLEAKRRRQGLKVVRGPQVARG